MLARVIGLRAKATAIDVPSSIVFGVFGREQQREERVVGRLGGPEAVVAGLLVFFGRRWRLCQSSAHAESTVYLHQLRSCTRLRPAKQTGSWLAVCVSHRSWVSSREPSRYR